MFQQIVFLFQICSIFMVETIKYNLFGTNIIKNIAYKLAKVNILCVKIFQAISLNIDKSINDELIKYTDHVPYSFYEDIDFDTLIDITSQEGLYIDIDKPIASGMISIVYKALLQKPEENGGQYKIIKIKRKNIEQKLDESIKNMEFLIKVFTGFISLLSYFNPDLHINDFNISVELHKNIDLIKEQLDFNKEVENMKEMKELYKNNDYIKIPEVFSNITKKYSNIILMEYIDGITISNVEETDYEIYAKQVFTFSFSSLLVKGTIHGDLHSGNILFIKEKREKGEKGENDKPIYKLGIIDFGLVYKLDDDFKNKFAELFIDIYTKPIIEVAPEILICGIFEPIECINALPEKHKQHIIQLMAEIIDDIFYKNKKGGLINIIDFILKINNYFNENNLKEYNIRISKNFLKVQMVMAMSQGIGIMLCKDKNIEMTNQVIREIFHLDLIEEREDIKDTAD
jgi:predicted unusual protein kinase regulating ubiquinone biosynthesis (AarF/ABC1/UbiB family)